MSAVIEPTPASMLSVWLKATRPATLLAGVVPVGVGTALAASDGNFSSGPAIAALVGALLLQVGCNFANDLFDFIKGADDEHRLGPARMTQRGHVTVRTMAQATALAMIMATLVGLYLVWVAGWVVVAIGLAGIAAGVFYTAGPRPLGYLGLGEVLVFIFFGLVAVGGTYFVQAETINLKVLGLGASVGLLASAILVVNNLRDRHTDVRVGKRTLAVRFGETFSRFEYVALVIAAYLPPCVLAITEERPAVFLVLLSLPMAYLTIRNFLRSDGAALNPLLGQTARLEAVFGALFVAGVLL